MTDGGDYAFGIVYERSFGKHGETRQTIEGLTKLEWFAGMALCSGKSAQEAISEAQQLITYLNKDVYTQTHYERKNNPIV